MSRSTSVAAWCAESFSSSDGSSSGSDLDNSWPRATLRVSSRPPLRFISSLSPPSPLTDLLALLPLSSVVPSPAGVDEHRLLTSLGGSTPSPLATSLRQLPSSLPKCDSTHRPVVAAQLDRASSALRAAFLS